MRSDLLQKYWFHLHTNYTDGSLSVEDYFTLAKNSSTEELIFLEHIRREPDYNVEEFVGAVKHFSEKFQIKSRVGFEAKILPNGNLDISPGHLELSDVVGIAEHGFPSDEAFFMEAWEKALDFAKQFLKEKEVVWVHPGLFFRKHRLLETRLSTYYDMLKHAFDLGVKIEHNLRYNLLPNPEEWGRPYVLGIDAHQKEDIILWEKFLT